MDKNEKNQEFREEGDVVDRTIEELDKLRDDEKWEIAQFKILNFLEARESRKIASNDDRLIIIECILAEAYINQMNKESAKQLGLQRKDTICPKDVIVILGKLDKLEGREDEKTKTLQQFESINIDDKYFEYIGCQPYRKIFIYEALIEKVQQELTSSSREKAMKTLETIIDIEFATKYDHYKSKKDKNDVITHHLAFLIEFTLFKYIELVQQTKLYQKGISLLRNIIFVHRGAVRSRMKIHLLILLARTISAVAAVTDNAKREAEKESIGFHKSLTTGERKKNKFYASNNITISETSSAGVLNSEIEQYTRQASELIFKHFEKKQQTIGKLEVLSKPKNFRDFIFENNEKIREFLSSMKFKLPDHFCGLVLKSVSNIKEQKKIFQAHFRRDQTNVTYLYYFILSLYKMEKYEKCYLMIKQYLATNNEQMKGKKPNVLMLATKICINNLGKYNKGLEYIKVCVSELENTSIEEHKTFIPIAFTFLGICYSIISDTDVIHSKRKINKLRAIECFTVSMKQDKNNYITLYNYAREQAEMGNLQEAESVVKDSLKKEKKQVFGAALYAILLASTEDVYAGLEIINRYSGHFKNNPLLLLIKAYLELEHVARMKTFMDEYAAGAGKDLTGQRDFQRHYSLMDIHELDSVDKNIGNSLKFDEGEEGSDLRMTPMINGGKEKPLSRPGTTMKAISEGKKPLKTIQHLLEILEKNQHNNTFIHKLNSTKCFVDEEKKEYNVTQLFDLLVARVHYVKMLLKIGDVQQAERFFKQHFEHFEQASKEVLALKSEILYTKGNYRESLEILLSIIEENETYIEVLVKAGEIYLNNIKDTEKAFIHLSQVLKINNTHSHALYFTIDNCRKLMGSLYLEKGDMETAAEYFSQAVKSAYNETIIPLNIIPKLII